MSTKSILALLSVLLVAVVIAFASGVFSPAAIAPSTAGDSAEPADSATGSAKRVANGAVLDGAVDPVEAALARERVERQGDAPSAGGATHRVVGRLVDDAGQPVVEQTVLLRPEMPSWLPDTPAQRLKAETDSEGRFSLPLEGSEGGEVVLVEGEWVLEGGAGQFDGTGSDVDLGDLLAHPASAIAGVVVDRSGRPVKGVAVTVGSGGMLVFSPTTMHQEATGEDGAFRVSGLVPGKKFLRTLSGGYLPSGIEIELEPGEQRTDLRLVLEEGRAIAGRVVDDLGRPIEGAKVAAQRTEVRGGAEIVSMRREEAVTTDATGFFILGGLDGDSTDLQSWCDGHSPGRMAKVTPDTRNVLIAMQRLSAVEGVLVSDAGEPLVGSTVALKPAVGKLFDGVTVVNENLSATTDDRGWFSIEGAPAGHGILAATGPHREVSQPVQLRPGDTVANVRLVAAVGGILEVTVTDPAGQPVEGAEVSVQAPAANDGDGRVRIVERRSGGASFGTGEGEARTATTDADGVARVAGLGGGAKQVGATHERFAAAQAAAVQTGSVGVTKASLTLRPAGQLAVRVLDASGEPVAKSGFAIVGPDGESAEHTTDGRGLCTVDGLAAGEYTVVLTLPAYPMDLGGMGLAVFSFDGARKLKSTGVRARVVSGKTVDVDLVKPVLTALSGRVTDASGPVEDAVVSLIAKPGGEDEGTGRISTGPRGTTDAEGRFEILDLTPGTYTVRWGRAGQRVKDEQELVIAPGVAAVVQNLTLRGGALAVSAVDDTGAPVAGAEVHVVRNGANGTAGRRSESIMMIGYASGDGSSGPNMSRMTVGKDQVRTDADGKALVEDVPPGSYTLSIEADGFAEGSTGTVVVVDGQTLAVPMVTLVPAAAVSGKVMTASGQVSMHMVEYRPAGSDDEWSTEVGSGEGFRVSGLKPGRWVFRATRLGAPAGKFGPEVEVDLSAGDNPDLKLSVDS